MRTAGQWCRLAAIHCWPSGSPLLSQFFASWGDLLMMKGEPMSGVVRARVFRNKSRWLLCTFVLVGSVFVPNARSAEPERQAPNICWTTEELAFRPGEERIDPAAPKKYGTLQNRAPATFTPLPRHERQVIRRVDLPHGKKVIALTFDLCEQPHETSGYQGNIVDFLRKNKIPATFFAGGKWMLSHRERAQQLMSDQLFEVGNHTWEHRNLRILRGSALVKEIERAQLAYEVLERLACRQTVHKL